MAKGHIRRDLRGVWSRTIRGAGPTIPEAGGAQMRGQPSALVRSASQAFTGTTGKRRTRGQIRAGYKGVRAGGGARRIL